MLDKIQLYLKSKIGQPWAYYITCCIYLLFMYIPLTAICYVFDIIIWLIVSSMIVNCLRSYTYGFHCHTNDKCLIISTILITIFGILSKNIPCEYSFFIAVICCRDIYVKSPLKLNEEIDKPIEWYIKRISSIIVVLLSLSLLFYYFHLTLLCSCVLWSIILVDSLLFANTNDYI